MDMGAALGYYWVKKSDERLKRLSPSVPPFKREIIPVVDLQRPIVKYGLSTESLLLYRIRSLENRCHFTTDHCQI